MDQQRVEEKNEKEEQSEESESVTDRSEEEMSDMMIHVAFEGGKESAKTYDPYFGMMIPSDGSSQKATQKRLISEISLFSLVFKRRATGEKAPSSAHRESAKSALFL